MGNLLKILSQNCLEQSSNFGDEIFIDFDNVGIRGEVVLLLIWLESVTKNDLGIKDPKEPERELYYKIAPVLTSGHQILE